MQAGASSKREWLDALDDVLEMRGEEEGQGACC